MLILIKGAGDLASGTALRLYRAGMDVVMTELDRPSAIRRTVAFSQAVYDGETMVEDVRGVHAQNAEEARAAMDKGYIPVLSGEGAMDAAKSLRPDVFVDATISKRNTGTSITDAPAVIALGPGFTVGVDCHAAVETMRGHDLGRVYYKAGESPLPNTGVPGLIAGASRERVMYTPCAGKFHCIRHIGDTVEANEAVAEVNGEYVRAEIAGTLRGILPEGYAAPANMKCADVDPRCKRSHCFTCSDKVNAIGGAVLEAAMRLHGAKRA